MRISHPTASCHVGCSSILFGCGSAALCSFVAKSGAGFKIKGAFAYAGKRYMAKKEETPVLEQKPGRYWGVIGRKHLPLGKREDREVSASQAVKLRRVMRRYRLANAPPEKRKYLRKSQLWSEDFTAKLFCNVEFWFERLPELIGLCGSTAIVIPNSGVDP